MTLMPIHNQISVDPLSTLLNELEFKVYNFGRLRVDYPFKQENNLLGNFKLVIINAGKVDLTIDRYAFELHANDIVILPPLMAHTIESKGGISDHYYLHFDTSNIDQRVALASLFPKGFAVYPQAFPKVFRPLFELVDTSVKTKRSGCAYAARCLLQMNIGYTQTQPAMKQSVFLNPTNTRKQQLVAKAMEYVDLHLYDPISVNDLCHALGVTQSYLRQCFFSVFHMSTKSFLDTYKLHYIESELIQSDRNISDIASRYGYTSIYAFSTLFKKICHMSPLQYRKAHSH